MLKSKKPAAGQIANENYPRELMQLFTTGIFASETGVASTDAGNLVDSPRHPLPA